MCQQKKYRLNIFSIVWVVQWLCCRQLCYLFWVQFCLYIIIFYLHLSFKYFERVFNSGYTYIIKIDRSIKLFSDIVNRSLFYIQFSFSTLVWTALIFFISLTLWHLSEWNLSICPLRSVLLHLDPKINCYKSQGHDIKTWNK